MPQHFLKATLLAAAFLCSCALTSPSIGSSIQSEYYDTDKVLNIIINPINLNIVQPFATIYSVYDKASIDTQPNSPYIDMCESEKETVIEALKEITMSYKETTSKKECRDLFRLLLTTALFSFKDKPDDKHVRTFFKILEHFIDIPLHLDEKDMLIHLNEWERLSSKKFDNPDYYLRADYRTFVACQLYMAQLLTDPSKRQNPRFSPKFDFFWKDESLDPLKALNKSSGILTYYRNTGFGSNCYNECISPQAMTRLWPKQIALPVLISLSDELILKHWPDGDHNLWLIGLPKAPAAADGGIMEPNLFVTHDYFHLHTFSDSFYSRALHAAIIPIKDGACDCIRLMHEYFSDKNIFNFFESKQAIYYDSVKEMKNWVYAATDSDEKRLRIFSAFYLFHESVFYFDVKFIKNPYYLPAKFKNLTLEHLSNQNYYRSLLPQNMQNIFMPENNRSGDEKNNELKKIKSKITDLCDFLYDKYDQNKDEWYNICDYFATALIDNIFKKEFGNTIYPNVSFFFEKEQEYIILTFLVDAQNNIIHKVIATPEIDKNITELRLPDLAHPAYPYNELSDLSDRIT